MDKLLNDLPIEELQRRLAMIVVIGSLSFMIIGLGWTVLSTLVFILATGNMILGVIGVVIVHSNPTVMVEWNKIGMANQGHNYMLSKYSYLYRFDNYYILQAYVVVILLFACGFPILASFYYIANVLAHQSQYSIIEDNDIELNIDTDYENNPYSERKSKFQKVFNEVCRIGH